MRVHKEIKRLFTIVVLACIPGSMCAANSLFYAPQGSIKEMLGEGIEYAQQGIDICIHDFAALDIDEKLESAKNRGVRIRVTVVEHDCNGLKGSLAKILIKKKFDVRIVKPQFSNNLVQDFIILDDRVLATGVYNWLAYRDREAHCDVVFSHDIDKIREYKETFYRLFTEGENVSLVAVQNEPEIKGALPSPSPVSDIKQGAAPEEPNQETTLIKEPEKPAGVATKEFIQTSFDELDKQFGRESNLSRSEKNELWKKYKGKYIRWNGVIVYKGMGRVDWNRIGVSQKKNKNVDIEILFDWKRFERVMNVRVGDTITYTGKLISYPRISAPYRLDDGDIE